MPVSDIPMVVRSFADADLSIRGDGRTIYGLAVPFGSLTSIRDTEGDYEEQFKRGAFSRTINNTPLRRVKLRMLHDKASTNGVAVELREDPAGLIAAMRVSKTQRGDEMLELVRDGAFDQFSIGFKPIRTNWSDIGDTHGVRQSPARNATATRTEVALLEISVVDFAAYDTALIGGVRNNSDATLSADSAEDPVEQTHDSGLTVVSWQHIQNVRAFKDRLAKLTQE